MLLISYCGSVVREMFDEKKLFYFILILFYLLCLINYIINKKSPRTAAFLHHRAAKWLHRFPY